MHWLLTWTDRRIKIYTQENNHPNPFCLQLKPSVVMLLLCYVTTPAKQNSTLLTLLTEAMWQAQTWSAVWVLKQLLKHMHLFSSDCGCCLWSGWIYMSKVHCLWPCVATLHCKKLLRINNHPNKQNALAPLNYTETNKYSASQDVKRGWVAVWASKDRQLRIWAMDSAKSNNSTLPAIT